MNQFDEIIDRCKIVVFFNGFHMIELYTFGTINGRSVSIALHELELDYKLHKVDLYKGEQKKPAFLAINPSARIPVLVDHDTPTGHAITISQSTAILIYLAEKSGKLLAKDSEKRAQTLEWLLFYATDIAPNIFNNFFLKSLVKPAHPDAANLLKNRFMEFYHLFDQQLEKNTYLAGTQYSIADIAVYPAVSLIDTEKLIGLGLKNIHRWFLLLSERVAVIQGMNVPK
ncbi:MAG: glutathione S-transferase family protein [Proteobacteria bacterium]|nr:glutathione S-transferase family protein [Pseudomonadota bacterium]